MNINKNNRDIAFKILEYCTRNIVLGMYGQNYFYWSICIVENFYKFVFGICGVPCWLFFGYSSYSH